MAKSSKKGQLVKREKAPRSYSAVLDEITNLYVIGKVGWLDPFVLSSGERRGIVTREFFEHTWCPELDFDNAALQSDGDGVGAVVRTEFRENIPHVSFGGFL